MSEWERQNHLHVQRWKHRRTMTWATLVAALVAFPVAAYFNPELVDMAVPFYTFCTAVVSVYIGFSTVDDKWNRNYPANDTDKNR